MGKGVGRGGRVVVGACVGVGGSSGQLAGLVDVSFTSSLPGILTRPSHSQPLCPSFPLGRLLTVWTRRIAAGLSLPRSRHSSFAQSFDSSPMLSSLIFFTLASSFHYIYIMFQFISPQVRSIRLHFLNESTPILSLFSVKAAVTIQRQLVDCKPS